MGWEGGKIDGVWKRWCGRDIRKDWWIIRGIDSCLIFWEGNSDEGENDIFNLFGECGEQESGIKCRIFSSAFCLNYW